MKPDAIVYMINAVKAGIRSYVILCGSVTITYQVSALCVEVKEISRLLYSQDHREMGTPIVCAHVIIYFDEFSALRFFQG